MDTQMRSYPIIRDVRRRNCAVRYGSAVLLLLGVTPCTVRAQTGTSVFGSFSVAQSSATSPSPDHDLASVLADTLNPYRSQVKILLMRDDVQHELGLNPRQQEQIAALSEKTENSLRAVNSKIGAMVPRPKNDDSSQASSYSLIIEPDGKVTAKGTDALLAQEMAAKMQEGRAQVQQEDQKQRDAILTPAQRTRLKELDRQWRGPFLLLSTIGAEEMKLSDAQWMKFQNVWKRLETRLARNEKDLAPKAAVFIRDYGRAAGQQEGFRALMRQLWREDRQSRAEAEQQALAVLSSVQQQKWAVWTGKPFTFREYETPDRPSLPR